MGGTSEEMSPLPTDAFRTCPRPQFRDEYPQALLMSVSALPLSVGENPVQCYNSVFSLAALQEFADCILLYENDRLVTAAEGSRPPTDAAPQLPTSTSLVQMNGIIVKELVPIFCSPQPSVPFDLGELVAAVSPMPTHRFVQTFAGDARAPHGTLTDTQPLLTALARSLPRTSRPAEGGLTLGAQAFVRGLQAPATDKFRCDILEKLGGPVAWQPHALEVRSSHVPLSSARSSARVDVVVNWKRISNVLGVVLAKARKKHGSRAFVHCTSGTGLGTTCSRTRSRRWRMS